MINSIKIIWSTYLVAPTRNCTALYLPWQIFSEYAINFETRTRNGLTIEILIRNLIENYTTIIPEVLTIYVRFEMKWNETKQIESNRMWNVLSQLLIICFVRDFYRCSNLLLTVTKLRCIVYFLFIIDEKKEFRIKVRRNILKFGCIRYHPIGFDILCQFLLLAQNVSTVAECYGRHHIRLRSIILLSNVNIDGWAFTSTDQAHHINICIIGEYLTSELWRIKESPARSAYHVQYISNPIMYSSTVHSRHLRHKTQAHIKIFSLCFLNGMDWIENLLHR